MTGLETKEKRKKLGLTQIELDKATTTAPIAVPCKK